MTKVSVIIVLYNEFDLVLQSIASVYAQKFPHMEIILSDNSSDLKGHKKILKKFPKIRYYHNNDDLGFAAGVNAGAAHAKGEYLLILTPDMYLLPGTLQKTATYLDKHKNVGLVGARVFSSPDSQELSVVSHYPGIATSLFYYNMPYYKILRRIAKDYNPMYYPLKDYDSEISAKALSGQYMLVRKKAFMSIKSFDTRFFLYFEDIDLTKRLNEKGWKVIYLPVGGVVQNGMSDWKKSIRITQALSPYMKSQYLFLKKHYGIFYASLVWLTTAFSATISIPYLFIVSRAKKLFGKTSQATDLLPLWIKIVKWHFSSGLKIVFSK